MDSVTKKAMFAVELFFMFLSLLPWVKPQNLIIDSPMVKNYDSYGFYYCLPAESRCETNGDCCSGCCQEAVFLCSARNTDCFGTNPCSNFQCPFTTRCYVRPSGEPHCMPEYYPTFFANCHPDCPYGFNCKTFSHVNPSYSKCVIDDPCAGRRCPAGLICENPIATFVYPPKCVPDPCQQVTCVPPYVCRLKPNAYPPTAECVPAGPCVTIRCANGFECETIPGSYPAQGRCVVSLKDPCQSITCDEGRVCEVQPNTFPMRPNCNYKPRPAPCSAITCRPGYICVLQTDATPINTQCEPIFPCSTPMNPCSTHELCVEVQRPCFNKWPCPATAQCYPKNPCINTHCGQGYTCRVREPACYVPPCLSVAECILTNPCSAIFSPCSITEFCVESDVPCSTPPCPRVHQCFSRFW